MAKNKHVCPSCGSKLGKNNKYCAQCGIKLPKRKSVIPVLAGILLILLICIAALIVYPNLREADTAPSVMPAPVIEQMSEVSQDDFQVDLAEAPAEESASVTTGLFADSALNDDFLLVCKETELDIESVSNLQRVEDWEAGEQYMFLYRNMNFRLLVKGSAVESMILGADTEVYQRGGASYLISDCIPDYQVTEILVPLAREYVSSYYNDPIAEYPSLDWTFGRKGDLYSVSSTVKTNKVSGGDRDIPFDLTYLLEGADLSLQYAKIDGTVVIDTLGISPSESVITEASEAGELSAAAEQEQVYTDRNIIRNVQSALNANGYNCGTPDGDAGPKTWEALHNYQRDHNIPETDTITAEVLLRLGIPVP